MNVLTKIKLNSIGFTLLTAAGIIASPVVQVQNNTKGKVEFNVDALGGIKNKWMVVDSSTNEFYDSNGRMLETVKIQYSPADGSPMLSWTHKIPAAQNSTGWTWVYSVGNDYIEYASSKKPMEMGKTITFPSANFDKTDRHDW